MDVAGTIATIDYFYIIFRRAASVFQKLGYVTQKLIVDRKTILTKAHNVCILHVNHLNTRVITKNVFLRIIFAMEKTTVWITAMKKG